MLRAATCSALPAAELLIGLSASTERSLEWLEPSAPSAELPPSASAKPPRERTNSANAASSRARSSLLIAYTCAGHT
eukprot:3064709-Prymnesium_polylepis.1